MSEGLRAQIRLLSMSVVGFALIGPVPNLGCASRMAGVFADDPPAEAEPPHDRDRAEPSAGPGLADPTGASSPAADDGQAAPGEAVTPPASDPRAPEPRPADVPSAGEGESGGAGQGPADDSDPGDRPEPADPAPEGPPGILAEALQKSLHFYDAEKSGPGITGGRLQWRGDSELADMRVPLRPMDERGAGTNLSSAFIGKYLQVLDPDGDGTVDLSGGFHDAGDHVKFGLPQAYAASTLGWAVYEFRESFTQSRQLGHVVEILRWFTDYFLRGTFFDETGRVIAFAYQVGEGSVDHNYWGPPELQRADDYARPAYFATADQPASDQVAAAAAALALMYLNSAEDDPPYADRCLEAAMAMYDFAVEHRGLGYSGGFYGSSYDQDDLAWAAVWLHRATGNRRYLDDIIAVTEGGQYAGYLGRIMANVQDGWQNIWVHCWDTVWGGVFLALAAVTDEPKFWDIAQWNLEYWSGLPHADPADSVHIPTTPAGFSFLNTWGSARYNAAAQLCALVFHKYRNQPEFAAWAFGQMRYLMGDNPLGRSYIVGLTDSYASHPHHRAAHGSLVNRAEEPPQHAHTLWGALVGGPGSNDEHIDQTSDYIYNEVAIDYNAGLVGALAGLYAYFGQGQQPLADFPPQEPAVVSYYASGKIEQENGERTQLTVTVHNLSIHPPAYVDGLSARYYFDIAEMVAAGQSVKDVSVQVMYDESAVADGHPVRVLGPLPHGSADTVFYVELDWSGLPLYGKREIQIALVAGQDGAWTAHWDPSNDWSRADLSASPTETEHIPVYLQGELVFGREPP